MSAKPANRNALPVAFVICVYLRIKPPRGAILLAGGDKGKRYALPNSRIMIHQPLGGFQGQASDFEIHAKEILHMKKVVNDILSKHTGQPIKKIEKDTDRDNFLDAPSAVKYGIVDSILEQRDKKNGK